MDKSDIRRLVKAQKALLEVAEQAEAAERAFARFETSESPRTFDLLNVLGGYHLWQSKDDKQHFVGKDR